MAYAAEDDRVAIIRKLFGRARDSALILTWWRFEYYRKWQVRLAVQSVDVMQSTPKLLRDYDAFRLNAVGSYLGVRGAFLPHREAESRR